MSVRYIFESKDSLLAHIEELRQRAEHLAHVERLKERRLTASGECFAYQHLIHMLRNSNVRVGD